MGVQFMVNGTIGKLGDKYTIDAKMFSVETGAAERTVSATHEGDVSGLLVEMQILAWEIVGLNAPQSLLMKRKVQSAADDKMTLARLDFEPRGISTLEAQTLTDRFSTEVNKTGVAILIDRNAMGEIMQEQGYTEVECSSEECAAEVGAMLGVQFMISGAIGKLGDTFTIDAKMVSVESGASVETRNVTYIGKVDGLVTEIELLAWDIMNLEPPEALKEKKRLGAEAFFEAAAAQKTKMGALILSLIHI